MISLKRFFMFALSLPLLCGLLALLIPDIQPYYNDPNFLVKSILLEGLRSWFAYTFFAFSVIYWARKKSLSEIKVVIWTLPLLFLPLAGLTFWISYPDRLNKLGVVIAFWLIYGYFYVILTRLLAWFLTKCGIIKAETI